MGRGREGRRAAGFIAQLAQETEGLFVRQRPLGLDHVVRAVAPGLFALGDGDAVSDA
ncbi:hypothetical protein CH063_14822, partial [Colletotrichum higginsianum]